MLKKILIYGIGTFFSKILVFFMVPIYTRFLTPADYGYYDVLLSNMQLLATVAFMEIWSGIIRFMFDAKEPFASIKSFFSLFPVFGIIYAVLFIISYNIFDFRFPVIAFSYGLAYVLFSVMNSICRGLEKNIDYVISGVISTIISCSFSFFALVVFNMGCDSLLLSLIAGYICSILFIEFRTHAIRCSLRAGISSNNKKSIFLYCLPLMLNTFSYSFLSLFNKNIIISKIGESASGYYAVAEKVSAVLALGISIYLLAWQEEAFANSNNDKQAVIYSYYLNQFIRFIGLLVPVYMLCCYFLMPLINGTQFSAALTLIPLFSLQVYISQLSGFFSTIIAVNKRTFRILFSTIIGSIVNIAFMIILVPRIGELASNASLCIAFSVCALLRYYFSQCVVKIRFSFFWAIIVLLEFSIAYFLFIMGNVFFIALALFFFMFVWILANISEFKQILSRLSCI